MSGKLQVIKLAVGIKSLESNKDDQSQSILYDTFKNETKNKKQHRHLKNYGGLLSVTSL